jgi:hypothetical protein
MAGPLCIDFPGATHQPTARDDRREPIFVDDARAAPSPKPHPVVFGDSLRIVLVVATIALLGACAQPSAPQQALDLVSIEQRLQSLEQRFDMLERFMTNLPAPPLRNRGEIEKNIQSLESKRTALLERYTSAHPNVREVELSLRLLKLQLEFLDQANPAPK